MIQWRCFYCGEVFTLEQETEARWHFGDRMHATAVCKFSAEDFRRMEVELERYRNADSDMHRLLRERESAQQNALRVAEETGYARRLADANLWPNLI